LARLRRCVLGGRSRLDCRAAPAMAALATLATSGGRLFWIGLRDQVERYLRGGCLRSGDRRLGGAGPLPRRTARGRPTVARMDWHDADGGGAGLLLVRRDGVGGVYRHVDELAHSL